ncbi:O-methylsterigmatocystin oxidoreductase [Favolaschia claudopus]|uniref:O-methylsterigmatocystin oxidoreductase n=1 Tax=Favolaschia claudopus TaxID=2862362 RepID=A0AAW0DAS3_9AGAR
MVGRLYLYSFAFAFLLLWIVVKWLPARRLHPFPPGPPPQFLIGNFSQLPEKHPWLTYTEWGRKYGDLVHASALGQHIVIVNSVKTATELFDKRSHIYSDRPVITMVDLMDWTFNLGLMPLGDRWRAHRRMFQTHFRSDVSREYRPSQMKKVHQFLRGLLSSPEDFMEHIKTMAAATIMETIYGYEVQPTNDRFVAIAEKAVKKLSDSFFPGAVAVNTFPILRHLPSWMPGAGFHRYAAECRELTAEMQKVPFEFTKQNMNSGVDLTSVVAKLLAENQARGCPNDENVQQMAAAAYAAGADSTVSALGSFFLALTLHPECQRKAQREIDALITERLPVFEDRAALPYVEALYREVMRWKPIVPLGLPHATSADDVWNGYFIPKGATVISNIWAMTRDESVYSDPERFNPDRFFTPDGKLNDDDTVLSFGFGRRICVGRYYADAVMWLSFVCVLSLFNVDKAKDAAGNDIEIEPVYSDGLVSHPQPFVCSIPPRSETTKSLIQATAESREL